MLACSHKFRILHPQKRRQVLL
ncbi:hypothetical protein EC960932_4087, partial [Escherichia coli 96.0932]